MAILIPGVDAATIGATVAANRRGRVKRTYYPVVLLRVTVRLDDFTNEDGDMAMDDSLPATSPVVQALRDRNTARTNAAVLSALGEADLETEATDRAADLKLAADVGAIQAPPGNVPPDDLSFTVDIVPLDAKIELNSFRIADKLQASFALADLPIIPDIIRSLFVEAYVGTASAADFAVPERWIPNLVGTQTPTFRGYADVEDMEAGDDFRICIQARSMEAVLMDKKVHPMTKERRIKRTDSYRDPETGKLVHGEKLTSFVKRFLSTVPEFNGAPGASMDVRIFPNFDGKEEPVLSAALFTRSLQTAQSRAAAGGPVQAAPTDPSGVAGAAQEGGGTPVMPAQTPSELTVWDVLVRACALCGMIPVYDPSVLYRNAPAGGSEGPTTVVRGADTILLMLPQTVKETPRDGLFIAGGPTDGFSREITMGGVGAPLHTEVRFLVWGHNIKRMKTSRKFGRVKAPAVRVVCYNPDAEAAGRVMVAQYPTTPIGSGHTSAAGTGGGKRGKGHRPSMEVITKEVQGIRDLGMLKQIAVGFYHSLSRHEVSVEIETDELSSYIDPTRPESHNENPDLLRLRPGTPCRVLVANRVTDPTSGAMTVDALSNLFARRANPAFLRKALLDSATSRALGAKGRQKIEDALSKIEASFQKAKLTDWFFCRVVNIDWSVEDGISITTELANFIEARNLTNLSTADKTDGDRRKKVKSVRAAAPDPRRQAAAANAADFIDRVVKGQI